MKTVVRVLLMLPFCIGAWANSNFAGNPYLPYPPGCAETPWEDVPAWLAARAVPFYSGEFTYYDNQSGTEIPLHLALYRSRCSEPNRSLIWFEFTWSDSSANGDIEMRLADVWVKQTKDWSIPMQLSSAPGGWQSGSWWDTGSASSYLVSKPQGLSADGDGAEPSKPVSQRWLFLLENIGPFGEWGKYYPVLTAEQYNDAFELSFLGKVIDVPATSTLIPDPEPGIPLSGRLSGIWVVEGAADQGVSLAISEFIPSVETGQVNRENPELLIFLAHYTFDAQGSLLWLAGNARFTPGANEIHVPVESISGGEFRGDRPADRVSVGQVVIRANNCNDLEFEFNYSALGLSSGTVHLQRPFSLETAGYECRDYAARVTANH
jgi:hypothetical protein